MKLKPQHLEDCTNTSANGNWCRDGPGFWAHYTHQFTSSNAYTEEYVPLYIIIFPQCRWYFYPDEEGWYRVCSTFLDAVCGVGEISIISSEVNIEPHSMPYPPILIYNYSKKSNYARHCFYRHIVIIPLWPPSLVPTSPRYSPDKSILLLLDVCILYSGPLFLWLLSLRFSTGR